MRFTIYDSTILFSNKGNCKVFKTTKCIAKTSVKSVIAFMVKLRNGLLINI